MNSLQHYFEQQNDKEAASIVADVVALLPSDTSVINWKNQGDVEKNGKVEEMNENVVLNNILLTKESEISALKEVILKWRNRALEAESNAELHFLDQLDLIQLQHEKELRSMESRYVRKLNEKEHVISSLEEQVGYLVSLRSNRDTDSIVSTIDEDYEGYEDDEDDEDIKSIISSIYDRDAEQQLTLIKSKPTICSNENTISSDELKSEAILDSIQDTMRAIELELSNKTGNRHHRRSPSSGTYFSSATLINSESATSDNSKKIKKSVFSINHIFKKAFPKLYSKKKSKYNNKTVHHHHHHHHQQQQQRHFMFNNTTASFPRSSTDETLGVYSTTSTVTNEDSNIHTMNFKTLLNHQPQQTMII